MSEPTLRARVEADWCDMVRLLLAVEDALQTVSRRLLSKRDVQLVDQIIEELRLKRVQLDAIRSHDLGPTSSSE